jgi:allantoicase
MLTDETMALSRVAFTVFDVVRTAINGASGEVTVNDFERRGSLVHPGGGISDQDAHRPAQRRKPARSWSYVARADVG